MIIPNRLAELKKELDPLMKDYLPGEGEDVEIGWDRCLEERGLPPMNDVISYCIYKGWDPLVLFVGLQMGYEVARKQHEAPEESPPTE